MTDATFNKSFGLTQVFEGVSKDETLRMTNAVIDEINGLFEFSIPNSESLCGRWDEELHNVTEQIQNEFDGKTNSSRRDDLDRLLRGLSSDRTEPCFGIVRDLAEIFYVQRLNRTEYVSHTESYKPFVISKILLEYAIKSRRIDLLLGSLTKPFCATKCDRLPEGCCVVLGYDLGLIPDKMRQLQEIESRLNGWHRPDKEDKCRFHGPRGCYQNLFKTPACIGFLCEALQDEMREKLSPQYMDGLMERLTRFRNCDIDRVEVFDAMDALIKWCEEWTPNSRQAVFL